MTGNGNASASNNFVYEIPDANIILDSVLFIDSLSDASQLHFYFYGHSDKITNFTIYFDTTANVSKYKNFAVYYGSSSNNYFNLLYGIVARPQWLTNGQKIYITAYPGRAISQIDDRVNSIMYLGLGKQSNTLSLSLN